jgi:CDGSH-type Zn-finger protein
MINTNQRPDRHSETVPEGKTVAFCRCWQSQNFPYCDGTHRTVNATGGDSVGPVIVKSSPAEDAG